MSRKICLAYSGGLDTSIILHWLVYEKSYDLIAFSADIGQEIFNKNEIEKRAKTTGAEKVIIKDLKKELIEEFAFRAIKSDAYYEDGYLLGTSIARPLIAKHQVEIAKRENCNILSHGATGKGNDQIRFELAYKVLYPEAIIYSPWKDKEFLKSFKSREEMIKYAEKNKLDIHSKSKSYSIDDNLLHISHEGGILEDPNNSSHKNLIKSSKENSSKLIEIEFEKGVPKILFIDDKKIEDSVEIFNLLNELSKRYCFGIIDIVENR
ncbi:MAG: argininosuccinate synthase, partial [Candidatus Anstonellales archaeon]